jgi:hypothetical protein
MTRYDAVSAQKALLALPLFLIFSVVFGAVPLKAAEPLGMEESAVHEISPEESEAQNAEDSSLPDYEDPDQALYSPDPLASSDPAAESSPDPDPLASSEPADDGLPEDLEAYLEMIDRQMEEAMYEESEERDTDMDGIPDNSEAGDSDQDGIPDYMDGSDDPLLDSGTTTEEEEQRKQNNIEALRRLIAGNEALKQEAIQIRDQAAAECDRLLMLRDDFSRRYNDPNTSKEEKASIFNEIENINRAYSDHNQRRNQQNRYIRQRDEAIQELQQELNQLLNGN